MPLFQRFLGSKLEHSDPLVRAKAYASGAVDEDTLSAALATEDAPQVLLEIVNKSSDIAAILRHTNAVSPISEAARLRLLELAAQPAEAGAEDWKQLYERAITERWSELPGFIDALRPAAGFEHLALGALQSCTSFAPEMLTPELLLDLVCNCQSSAVRLDAARLITEPESLETGCRELKDKDKSVYRILKGCLDEHKAREQMRATAQSLTGSCDELQALTIVAHAESIAAAAAKLQKLEEQVAQVGASGDGLQEVSHLQQQLAAVVPEFNQRLVVARDALGTRRRLTEELTQLGETAVEAAGPDDTLQALNKLRAEWAEVPDTTELEARRFDQQFDTVAARLVERQRNLGASDDLSSQLEVWERTVEPRDPEKALRHIESKWDSFEKPQDEALLLPLKQRYLAVCENLRVKAGQQQAKRAENSTALLGLLADFKTSIGNGDLKKAMSCHAKLKHRLNTELLDADVRAQTDAELRQAQTQLDEYRKWRHFGTIQARDNLIGEANTLVADPPASPNKVAERVKALRESWKKLDQGDGRSSSKQWETFSALLKEAYKPAKKHFKTLAKERKSNETIKREVIKTLSELHSNTDWQKPDWSSVCQVDKDARLQWIKSGVVDFKVRKELDQAYAKTTRDLDAAMHDERDREVRRRELLIAQLQRESDQAATREVAELAKRLQRSWRPTVQADRKTEQKLWQEFRTVCDAVFAKLKDESQAEKTAWQADADQRRQLCDALDRLVENGGEIDERELKVARSRAEEMRKEWAQRSAVPRAVLQKIERRFNASVKAFQQRAAKISRRHEQHRQRQLEELAALCQQAEQMAVIPATDAGQRTTLEQQWSELAEKLEGPAGKALGKRLDRALSAMDGNDGHRQEIEQAFEENLGERRQLCLMGELIADIPSPEEYAEERMKLQVKRLKDALQGGGGDKHQELQKLIRRWFELGGVATTHWQPLHERFSRIREAAGHL